MLTALFAAVAVALGPVAVDSAASPFAPPPVPAPKVLRLLAPSGAFNARMLIQFERESGYAVAYDAYGDPARIPALLKEPYDVVVLPGQALARAIAAKQLRAIEKSEIANASRIAPPVAAKLLSYDAIGGYGLAWGWSATGLLYDAGKASRLLGAVPNSWIDALAPAVSHRLTCGVALPDARDEMFIAAWRLMGVDPAKARDRDVKAAADVIARARAAVRQPASPDPISAIAGAAVCLTFGNAAQAGIASRRSRESGGGGLDIQFAQPREGGPVAINALAEPRDAPHPKEALALIDFLLRPSVVAEATAAAGLASAESDATVNFRGLWPVGVYDPALVPIIEKEWARLRASEQPAHAPEAKPANKPIRRKR